MKIKNKHIKILENFLVYNKDFGYDGNLTLKTRDTANSMFIEAYIPDFIDIPLYTCDLSNILRYLTTDCDVTVDIEDCIKYLIIKSDSGTIRYRLSHEAVVQRHVNNSFCFDTLSMADTQFKFNLDSEKYKNLRKVATMLGCDMLKIYSIDNSKIGIQAYNNSDINSKQYTIEVEVEHQHHDWKTVIMMSTFDLVAASDYNIEIGHVIRKNGPVTMTKVQAFCDDVVVKYIMVNKDIM